MRRTNTEESTLSSSQDRCPYLHVGIGEARLPATVERAVRTSADLLALWTDDRASVLIKDILRSALKQELDYNPFSLLLS